MCNNKLKLILTVSMILNFIFIGYFVGCGFNKSGKHRWHKFNFAKIEQSNIPSDSKKLIIDTLKSIKAEKKSKLEEMMKIKQELKSIMTAQQFDNDKYMEKINSIKAIRDNMFQAMTTRFSELASKLSVDERKLLAETIDKKHKHYGKNK